MRRADGEIRRQHLAVKAIEIRRRLRPGRRASPRPPSGRPSRRAAPAPTRSACAVPDLHRPAQRHHHREQHDQVDREHDADRQQPAPVIGDHARPAARRRRRQTAPSSRASRAGVRRRAAVAGVAFASFRRRRAARRPPAGGHAVIALQFGAPGAVFFAADPAATARPGNAPVFSSASMNSSRSSMRRANTEIAHQHAAVVVDLRRSRRQCARRAAASAWNWFSSAVHENARRSISALASRAATCTAASCAWLIDWRMTLRLVAHLARLRVVLRDRLPRLAAGALEPEDLDGVEHGQADRHERQRRRARCAPPRSL